jgi:hypothetical protein
LGVVVELLLNLLRIHSSVQEHRRCKDVRKMCPGPSGQLGLSLGNVHQMVVECMQDGGGR